MSSFLETTTPLSEEERTARYGYREVPRRLPDGRIGHERVALTLEDLLHPQLGDFAVESSIHDQERHYLASVFRSQLEDDSTALVLSDCGVYWDVPELKHHAPDVAVAFNVRERRENWTSFRVAEQGTRPTLVVEIVSPDYRENDTVAKVAQYYRAGVLWYVIVDRERANDPPRLIVRRYQTQGWEVVPADERGRIWLPRVRIWLGVANGRVVCFDGATDEMLGDYSAVRRELAQARAHREMMESQMEMEIEARRESEARANAEAIRANGESARADTESTARQRLEEKVVALEAQLAARG